MRQNIYVNVDALDPDNIILRDELTRKIQRVMTDRNLLLGYVCFVYEETYRRMATPLDVDIVNQASRLYQQP